MRAETTTMGLNRTGIGTSPIDSQDIIDAAKQGVISPALDGHGIAELRESYENEAEPVGTVPVPTSLKGALRAMANLLKGKAPVVLIDKLGERLAFERSGTRLYDALLTKHEASPAWPGGPTRADLARFRAEELSHFEMLRACMEEVGADPTAETPSADVIGVASMGLMQVITDPRITMPQSLTALLTAELTDNDGWQMLVDLARMFDQDEMVKRFQIAQQEEAIHLGHVRNWLMAAVEHEVKG